MIPSEDSNNAASEDITSSPEPSIPAPSEDTAVENADPEVESIPIVLRFCWGCNFDEDSKPVARYDRENKGILGGISKELVDEMNEADIFMLNNEFAYSTRGTEIKENHIP